MTGFQIKGDLRISDDGRDLVLSDRILSVEQRIQIGATVFQGEWIYDQNSGIPWFQAVMVKGGQAVIRRVFSAFLLSVPGVLSVTSISADVDTVTRTAVVKYAVRCDDGSELTGALPYQIATR